MTVKGALASLLASLALAVAGGVAAAGGLPSLSDEFDAGALNGWNVVQGDDVGDGTNHSIELRGGSLVLTPRVSWWVNGTEALYVWKPVAGDFVVTMRVHVTGAQTEKPDADWTLSGILVRSPASTHASENWVSLRTGVVGGDWVYERKTTMRSRSTLVLSSSHDGWVDLRVARVADRFLLLRRNGAGRWSLLWTYTRADLPKTLQVGIDAFTGFESPHGDLVSHVDWFHFASPNVPTRLRRAAIAKLVPYVTRP